jgi:hypothetical protein
MLDTPETHTYVQDPVAYMQMLASREEVKPRLVVVTGTIVEGMHIWGPFANHNEAMQWVEKNLVDYHVIVVLDKPEEYYGR